MIPTHCVTKKTFNTNYKAFGKFFRSLNSTLKMKLIMNSRKLYIYASISRKTIPSHWLKATWVCYVFKGNIKTYCFLNCSGWRVQRHQNYNPTNIFNQPVVHPLLKNQEVIPGTAHRRKLPLPQTSLWLSQMDFQEHLTQAQEHTSVSGAKQRSGGKKQQQEQCY